MKKFIPLFLSISMLLASCGNSTIKIKPKATIYPSDLITAEELSSYIGYTPVMQENRSRRVSDAVYTSDPIGVADTVEIKLRQKNSIQTEDEIKEYFDECKAMRSDAFDVQLNEAVPAFIAYPTLYYYMKGYLVEVTAGSGSDDLQKNLLINIANITLEKLIPLSGEDLYANDDIDAVPEDDVENNAGQNE